MLDVPCGFGRHAVPLARAGHRVVGVDRSQSLLDEAARRAGSEPRLTFTRADYRELPFADERFDVAVEPVHFARLPRRRGGREGAARDPVGSCARAARSCSRRCTATRSSAASSSRTGGRSARAGCCSSSAPSILSRASPRRRRRSIERGGRARLAHVLGPRLHRHGAPRHDRAAPASPRPVLRRPRGAAPPRPPRRLGHRRAPVRSTTAARPNVCSQRRQGGSAHSARSRAPGPPPAASARRSARRWAAVGSGGSAGAGP